MVGTCLHSLRSRLHRPALINTNHKNGQRARGPTRVAEEAVPRGPLADYAGDDGPGVEPDAQPDGTQQGVCGVDERLRGRLNRREGETRHSHGVVERLRTPAAPP